MLLKYYLMLNNWLKGEEGQDVVEYAVLVIFIALIVLVGVGLFGEQMRDIYNQIAGKVSSGLQ
jgi:Flp pilus assembly pilin Flp